jgi:hypothetical protein
MIPVYWLLGAIPSVREGARRLGLVTIDQMVATLTWAVDTAGNESRTLDVPDIRRARRSTPRRQDETTA